MEVNVISSFYTFCMSSQYFYTAATMCSHIRCHEKRSEMSFLTLQKISTGRRFPSSENICQLFHCIWKRQREFRCAGYKKSPNTTSSSLVPPNLTLKTESATGYAIYTWEGDTRMVPETSKGNEGTIYALRYWESRSVYGEGGMEAVG